MKRKVKYTATTKSVEYLTPTKKEKGPTFVKTVDYQYFEGHVIPDIAKGLPKQPTVCWKNDHNLSLEICAVMKFCKQTSYCKRCTLFQGDAPAGELRALVEKWEVDDFEVTI